MSEGQILALQYLAGGLICLVQLVIVPGVFIWWVVGRTRRMTKRIDYTPPPEFQNRCPMCGSRRLQWGSYYSQFAFTPDGQQGYTGMIRRTQAQVPAARCRRCGYTMTFNLTE